MLDFSSEQIGDEIKYPEANREPQRRRRKRHRAHRLKWLERTRKKALIAFLYVLTIGLALAIWYGLLKG